MMKFTIFCLFATALTSALASPVELPSSVDLPNFAGVHEVHSECGGVLQIPTDGAVVIDYKSNEVYSTGESCIWSILANQSLSQIAIFVERDGFASTDGLILYGWKTNITNYYDHDYLIGKRIASSSSPHMESIDGQRGFLYFSAETKEGHVPGTGFRATIFGVSNPEGMDIYKHTALHVEEDECGKGIEILYPIFPATAYEANERLSIALQPRLANSYSVSKLPFVGTEHLQDIVDVFYLWPFSAGSSFIKSLNRRTSGTGYMGSNYPQEDWGAQILLFRSTSTRLGRGFAFHWRPGHL